MSNVEKEQDNCVGRQAESLFVTTDYITNVTSTDIIPVMGCGYSITISLPKSAQGTEVSTIITLINSEGSTDSAPKLTGKNLNYLIFHSLSEAHTLLNSLAMLFF